LIVGLAALPVAGCAGIIPQAEAQVRPIAAEARPTFTPETVAAPEARSPETGPSDQLEDAVAALGRSFNGSVGIAVRDIEQGWTVAWNGDQFMPQQSVSKTWVAMAVLDAVDRGDLSLERLVRVGPEHAVVFHQPMRSRIGRDGIRTTIRELFNEAMTRSDNLANDRLLWLSGGPDNVREFLSNNALEGIRFGPGERALQSGIAGMTWQQSYARGRNFQSARAGLPEQVRRDAMRRYLADPVDGATANGMVDALARLARGELLSPESTELMLSTMRRSRTGPQRLRGGVPDGWLFGHKTGTGQVLDGRVAGYNDVGIVTTPDGRNYAVAVLIGNTGVGIPARQRLMQAVMGQVVSHHLRRRYELFTGRRSGERTGS
jgi:beta-lactamase class A